MKSVAVAGPEALAELKEPPCRCRGSSNPSNTLPRDRHRVRLGPRGEATFLRRRRPRATPSRSTGASADQAANGDRAGRADGRSPRAGSARPSPDRRGVRGAHRRHGAARSSGSSTRAPGGSSTSPTWTSSARGQPRRARRRRRPARTPSKASCSSARARRRRSSRRRSRRRRRASTCASPTTWRRSSAPPRRTGAGSAARASRSRWSTAAGTATRSSRPTATRVQPPVTVIPGTNPARDPHGHGTGESANVFAIAPEARLRPYRAAERPGQPRRRAGRVRARQAGDRPDVLTNSWGGDYADPVPAAARPGRPRARRSRSATRSRRTSSSCSPPATAASAPRRRSRA